MQSLNESKAIYIAKGFAIFSVVCAHAAVEPENCAEVIRVIVRLMSYMGTYGVPMFFLFAGFFYARESRSLGKFWKHKASTIIVPWIFCESIVWLYVVLRKGGVTFENWIKFILGVNHSTYYLIVLLLFYILFWYLRRRAWVLWGCILLSLAALVAVGQSIPFVLHVNEWTITPYLNPLNWMMYFCAGILLFTQNKIQYLFQLAKRILPFSCVVLFGLIVYHLKANISWSYFSQFALINIIFQMLVVMGICARLSSRNPKQLIKIGEESFTIYLLHELGAGAIVRLSLCGGVVLIVLRPIINILLVKLGIWCIRFLLKERKKLRDTAYLLIGIRD